MKIVKAFSISLVILIVISFALIFFSKKPALYPEAVFSKAIYDENHQLLYLSLTSDQKYRFYTPLSEISPALVRATLLQEDQYFYYHMGINPISLVKAMVNTYLFKKRIGASTISMQLARLQLRINTKTPYGKCRQMWQALKLEFFYSKNDILSAYLNLVPYGNNVEGIGAASLLYFHHSPHLLTLNEALTLAVIPQNPGKRILLNQSFVKSRQHLWLKYLKQYLKSGIERGLIDLPVQLTRRKNAPFFAPHFVQEILSKPMSIHESTILTGFNLKLQQTIEKIVRAYLARKKVYGVENAAVLIVDSSTMQVKALLGSADFNNVALSGQIDGTIQYRSPGSTLKPLIYALALDQGLIHPHTILKDVPFTFNHYHPENFDRDYLGALTAEEALILSRNIPAVYLAEHLKHPNLYEFLHAAGIYHLKSENYYGLSLVLGGAEMSLQELVMLYAGLNNQGVFSPLKLTLKDEMNHHSVLVSKEAAFLVLNMLQKTPQHFIDLSHLKYPVAFKTGTSSGYRDAFTIGTAGSYVIGVWIGNFNNKSNHAFVGKEIAAPLFFEIIRAMSGMINKSEFKLSKKASLNIKEITICKESGLLPTETCPNLATTLFIPGKSPIQKDTIFKEVAINPKNGLRTCHINKETRFAVYEFWPSDVLTIFRKKGMVRKTPPPYEANCFMQVKEQGLVPQLVRPEMNQHYVLRKSDLAKSIVVFSAVVDADVHRLHWFLDQTYLGSTLRDENFIWQIKPGVFNVRVVDDFGRSDVRRFTVQIES